MPSFSLPQNGGHTDANRPMMGGGGIFGWEKVVGQIFSKISVLLMFAALFVWSQDAKATTCPREYISIERAFIDADVVLLGNAQESDQKDFQRVEITEAFKLPGDSEDVKTIYIPYTPEPPYEIGKEYLIYGKKRRNTDGITYVQTDYPCGQTKLTYQSAINELDALPGSAIIFSGTVLHSEQWLLESGRTIGEAEFGVNNLYENNLKQPLSKQDTIKVTIPGCSHNFAPGEEYLLIVRVLGQRPQSPQNPEEKLSKFYIECSSAHVKFTREKELLRKLSLHKKKEN